jgi:hypothetical protein
MSIRERVGREIKNELNRFLNWPAVQNMSLGMIGKWDGRRAVFTLESSLTAIGLKVRPANQLDLRHDDLYTSAGSVSINFQFDHKSSRSKADMQFRTKHALSSQCFRTHFEQLDLVDLLSQLKSKYRIKAHSGKSFIGTGSNDWDRDWLIITSIWAPESYTLLVSGAKDAHVTLGAETTNTSFNIADATISVSAESLHNTAYQMVATSGARPFYAAHRVMEHRGRLALKPYGTEGLTGLLV